MALTLQLVDLDNSPLRTSDAYDVSSIVESGPIEASFDSPAMSSPSPFQDNSFFVDIGRQQIAAVQNRVFSYVAGVKYVVGDRDGDGTQALLGIGGGWALGSCGLAVDSHGDLYFTATRYQKIKKLSHSTGSWVVSTFLTGVDSVSIYFDAQDNLWAVTPYDGIKKFSHDGQLLATYGLPLNNGTWQPSSADNVGHLWLNYRESYTDTGWQLDLATGQVTRKGGLLYDEYVAIQNQGLTPPIDGPVLHCTIHTADIGYVAPDGSVLIWGGGDETQARKMDFNTGRCSSLCADGQWRELQDIRGGFYIGAPSGIDENGWPYSRVFPWIAGSRTVWRKLVLVDVPTPPPGTQNNSQFVSQIIPATMQAGKQVTLSVTMQNTGTSTWSESTLHRLGGVNPALLGTLAPDDPTWGGRMLIPAGVTVAPGAQFTFTTTVKVPASGTYPCEWKMVQESVEWFGTPTPNIIVTVDQGGNVMTKNVVLDWSGAQTQNEAVANAQTADHFVVTLDAGAPVAVPGGLAARTFTFLGVPSGTHAVSVACADAAGNLLAPAVTGSAVVPNDPTAPIPVGITVTLA